MTSRTQQASRHPYQLQSLGDLHDERDNGPCFGVSSQKSPVVINNAAGVSARLRRILLFLRGSLEQWVARSSRQWQRMYVLSADGLRCRTLTSAALAGQATSCIGAELVSLLLALISYSIGIGHEYKVQNMAYVERLTLGPRQSSKSPMLWCTLRLIFHKALNEDPGMT